MDAYISCCWLFKFICLAIIKKRKQRCKYAIDVQEKNECCCRLDLETCLERVTDTHGEILIFIPFLLQVT